MELIASAFSQFNITHKIHLLHFGNSFPGLNFPLNEQVRSIEDTHGMYQYYLKIVPTTYKHLNGRETVTNQYAVTEHMRHLSPGSGRGLPGTFHILVCQRACIFNVLCFSLLAGLYFYYEISPISAYFEERRGHGGIVRLFTSICAIVGGSFTLFGLVDMMVGLASKVVGGSLL
jgi:hypothetical protein